MKWAFFGSSLVSAYWNGAATYYRGIIRALASRGHEVTFFEPDAYDRQKNRDIADPDWARVKVYSANESEMRRVLKEASGFDAIVKASGVGVFDEELERGVLELKTSSNLVLYWDVDAPATLDRMQSDPNDRFRRMVPDYDIVFTYGGGDPVVRRYEDFGARRCVPVYNALDESTHHPVEPDRRFEGTLGFLGNRLPDRERRVEDFFLHAASRLPAESFLLGGNGWQDKDVPRNVRYLGHVFTHEHNAFNCSLKAVLNLSRDSMADNGFSPATRVFEAAGAGACLITDAWKGIELFLEPGREILVAKDGEEVAGHVRSLTPEKSRKIGEAALKRIRSEHTYEHRVRLIEDVMEGRA